MPDPPIDTMAAPLSPETNLWRHHPLVVVFAAAGAGIVTDRFWAAPFICSLTAVVAGLALWLIFWRKSWRRSAAVVLLLVVAAIAAAWHHCRWHMMADDDLGCFARRKPQPVCVEATAVTMPRQQATPAFDPMRMMPAGERSRLEVDIMAVRDGAEWRPAAGRALLFISGPPPEIHAGDRLRCFASLSTPASPLNPGGFDRAAYLRADGIRSVLQADSPDCVSVIQPGGRFHPRRILDDTRVHGNRLFEKYLDPRCAEMAAMVLLGEREQVEYGRLEAYMATGTIHLLVISGVHISVLAAGMFWVMRRTPLPRGWAVLLVAIAAVFYTLLVDAGPPVVRATVLVLTTCAAVWLGRRPLGVNSLAAAALIVLAINPTHLFHVGAQLSFLAVAGILWFARWHRELFGKKTTIDRLIDENRDWPTWVWWALVRSTRYTIAISLVVWLLTMPLVMARFHLCTPIAFLINAVVWIPMAFALVSGCALLVLGSVSSLLAVLCGAVCNASLALLEWCVVVARKVPCGHFWVVGPADWWLIGFYGGLAVLAAFPRLRRRWAWCIALLLSWAAVGFLPTAWRHHPDRLDCTFIAVGHGCAAVLELPSGQTMLYDAGQFGAPSAGERAISGFLWSRGITRLDAVFLSHADVDHYNALPGLLERFSVGAVYVPPGMFAAHGQAIEALRTIVDQHRVPVRELRAGERLSGGDGCTLEVLHPLQQDTTANTNANSLVLAVDYLGGRILLPGDLESPGLQTVLSTEPRHCEVLMAPHHGSRQSNSPELAHWCTPTWVVFSDDGRWNLPEIDATYQAVGATTLHTNDSGAIQVQIDSHGVRMSPIVEP